MEEQGPKPRPWKEGVGAHKEGTMGMNGRKQGHGVGGRDSAGRHREGWQGGRGGRKDGISPKLGP